MVWFKVDDSFYDHPKIFDAPDCALALWVRAGTWSSRNLTNGFVPTKLFARFCDDPDTAVRELVDRGLWSRTKGGYQFHDWADYQPPAEKVLDDRKKNAERQRLFRQKRGQAVSSNAVTNALVTRDSRVTNAVSNAAPVPTRPVPTEERDSLRSSLPRKRVAPLDGDPAFTAFYSAYPKHVGRAAAITSWKKAIKSGVEANDVIAGAKRYAVERKSEDPRYTKQPATWLNQGCWTDEPTLGFSGHGYQGYQNPEQSAYYEEL